MRSDAISPKVADVLEKVMSGESGLNHEETSPHYTAHNQPTVYANHSHEKKEAQSGLPLLSNLYQNNYCPYPETSYSRRDSEQSDSSPRYSNPLGSGDKFSYRREETDSSQTADSSSYKPEKERSRHPSGHSTYQDNYKPEPEPAIGHPSYQDKYRPEPDSPSALLNRSNALPKEENEVTDDSSFPRNEEPGLKLADRRSLSREEEESALNGSFSREQDDGNPNTSQLNSSFNDSYHSDEDSFSEGLKSGLNESNSEHLLPEDYKNYSFNGIGTNPLASPGFLGNRQFSLPPLPRSADPSSASHGAYSKQTGLYFCHLCSFSAKCKDEFDAHMSIHFEYSCPHCDYTSRTEGRLKRHIKDFHSSDSEGFGTAKMQRMQTGRPKVYRCKQCSFASTTKIDFWQHSRSHIKEEKLLQCPRCPFVTEYKHHLEYHLRNHFGSKPFKCNKCNYSCVNKSMLNSHMKSHTNVYQYRCADCTYATKYCHSLKLHLKKYNHKPAAVLNSDGSLPQGLEPEASGLSLLSKRGPPRGPRGPRKDKMDQFMSPLFHLPHTTMAGMPPGLNGALMSPYWPLLNQLPNGMQPPPPLIPVNNMGGQMRPPQRQSSSSPEKVAKHEPGSVKCNLCSFTAETPEGLNSHVLKVHAAGENQDLFNMFGISSEALLDEHNLKAHMARQQSLSKPDGPLTPTSRPHNSMLHVQTDQSGNTSKSSPHSWPVNKAGGHARPASNSQSLPELAYASRNGSQDPHTTPEPLEGADILKQMTLKFGGGGGEAPRIRKESPLDLTKPKSVSPPAYPNMMCLPMMMPQHVLQMPLKRPFRDVDASSNENSTENAVSSPRKRSRKGKAYKLDTLCLKLQEKQSNSPYESESEESGSEVPPQEYVTETRTQPDDASPNGRGESPGSLKHEENFSPRQNGDQDSPVNESRSSPVAHKNDFEKIHENLKILNSGLKQEYSSDTANGDAQGNLENDEQKDCPSPDEMIKAEMSKDEVADYLNPQKPVSSALRRGAELAWKILNDGGSGGAPLSNGEIVLETPHNGLHPMGPDDKALPLPHQLSIDALTHGKVKPFRGADSFECHYCEIAFRDCVMYTMHMGYHGYQDPYKCNMCGHCSKDKVEFFLHIARAAHS